ncbi:uncharacterized protein [Miscanthus floridulus]|uniref:uncharacterized protein n=1 Tax=Miscanthus floridulus TaxID=154761 RepID=UPI003458F599
MSSSTLSDEEILHRVGETVEAKLRGGNLIPIAMRPSRGFLSLGMRDVRSSPPPVPEDTRRRAINRAHANAQKKQKDAKAVKHTKKILAREELDKRRRQQRKDVEMVPGALVSSLALLGGGGADPGSAIARSGAEADTPEAWALGKHAVSPVGSAAVVEQVAVEATQLPPQRTEGAPGSVEDQPAPMDTEAMPLPPPPPLRMRVIMAKQLPPRSSRKWPAEVPTLAPLKALKVNPSSTAHWVAEAQAALHHGAASARADPKELAPLGGAAEAALTQEGEVAPPPRDGEARGSDAAGLPLATETTGTEVPGVSQAGATETAAPGTIEAAAAGTEALATAEATMAEAGAPETAEAAMAEAGAPGTTEATMAEAGAPGTTDADAIVAGLPAQEMEMKAAKALAAPLVQGPPPLR